MSTEQNHAVIHALRACALAVVNLGAAFALGCWTQWRRDAKKRQVPPPNPSVVPQPQQVDPATPLSPVLQTSAAVKVPNQALAEALADFADEISDLQKSGDQNAAQMLTFASRKVDLLLEAAGAELIRSSDWNPQIQRAVEVRAALSGQKENEIVARGASGLRVNGQLIRKQEVILARQK